jgi:Lrp/AsnC family leucine-responsive transcriptional regulator
MNQSGDIDQFDLKILRELSVNGRITVTELAGKVGLTKTPRLARMRRLEARGYIRGYRAVIDPAKVGLGHIAFVEVKLSNTTEHALTAFDAAVRKQAEVEQCHMIAGGFDDLLKVRTGDITA